MKKLIFVICLGVAVPLVGCGMLKQSNAAHHAIEDHNYDVEKVVVKVENGRKTVVVHANQSLTDEEIAHIKQIVREKIPDAQKVKVRSPGQPLEPVKGKPPVKGNPPVEPVKGNPPVKGGPPGE